MMKSNLLCDVSKMRNHDWGRNTALIHKLKWISRHWIILLVEIFLILWEHFFSLAGPTSATLWAHTHIHTQSTLSNLHFNDTLRPALFFLVASEWPFPQRVTWLHCHTWAMFASSAESIFLLNSLCWYWSNCSNGHLRFVCFVRKYGFYIWLHCISPFWR